MSVVATAAVRITANTRDLQTNLKKGEQQIKQFAGSQLTLIKGADGAKLSLGRLGTGFAGLAGQIAGVHPVVGNVAGVLGNFAIGSALTVGVLAGVAAIAVAYDQLTGAAKKAKAENDKLIQSLEQANILEKMGPGAEEQKRLKPMRDQQMADRWKRTQLLRHGVPEDDGRILDLNVKIAYQQAQIEQGEKRLFDARVKAGTPLKTVVVESSRIASATERVVKGTQGAIAAAKELAFVWGTAAQFSDRFEKGTLESAVAMTKPDINMNSVGSIDVTFAKEEQKTREELSRASEQNAQMIVGALAQSASMIVGALNIGGGGKGSNLGGAIGGTAGSVAGMILGAPGGPLGMAIGSAIGSTIGQIGGSLLGGLFDNNTKATAENTAATRANTAILAQFLNAPSGYKTDGIRFDATEIRTAHQRYLTRGGTPILGVA